jgi:8-oxo-dGTP diphosphatase
VAIRRVGEAVRQGVRYRRRIGAYAVLVRDGRVLLTYQEDPLPEFQLPGGGLDPGESPVQALHREVFEETGWRISTPKRLGAFRRYTYMPEYDLWAEKLCLVYLARPVMRLGAPTEPGHEAVWTAGVLAAGLVANEGDRSFLEEIVG